jgi:hypothetical protein
MRLFTGALQSGEIRTPKELHDAMQRAMLIGSIRMGDLRKPERTVTKLVRVAIGAATEAFAAIMETGV